jgi:hypothetical protein
MSWHINYPQTFTVLVAALEERERKIGDSIINLADARYNYRNEAEQILNQVGLAYSPGPDDVDPQPPLVTGPYLSVPEADGELAPRMYTEEDAERHIAGGTPVNPITIQPGAIQITVKEEGLSPKKLAKIVRKAVNKAVRDYAL